MPAIRTDSFKGHTTLNATGQTYPLQDYGWINQPKLSVVYSPSPAFSLYGNWGRTFQIVTGLALARLPDHGNHCRQAVDQHRDRTGHQVPAMERTEARIAVWQQDATDEVANLPSANAT